VQNKHGPTIKINDGQMNKYKRSKSHTFMKFHASDRFILEDKKFLAQKKKTMYDCRCFYSD